MKTSALYYTAMQSPIGKLHLVSDDKALLSIGLGGPKPALKFKKSAQPNAVLTQTVAQLAEYFRGERLKFDLPTKLNGTEFQMKAWRSLEKIPYGKTISYREQAEKVGAGKAFRAVGSANGRNPLPIVIPCHRVVASDGKLGGYAGGLKMKARLLEIERRAGALV
jgi:methylated-DNA-[protein]-cysteine S-methyltransferase